MRLVATTTSAAKERVGARLRSIQEETQGASRFRDSNSRESAAIIAV
jgi:hypothetical protein